MIMIHSNEEHQKFEDVFRRPVSASILGYKKISATKYTVKISTTGPFVLGFTETFDEYWFAHIEGEGEIKSIPLDAMLNGFYINKTGNFTVTIEYKPQRWVELGLWITGFAISSSLCFLIWTYRRKWGRRLIGRNRSYHKLSETASGKKVN
jgi:hypothetical protein